MSSRGIRLEELWEELSILVLWSLQVDLTDSQSTVYLSRILGGIHYFLNALGFTTHIQDVCVFTAPIFSGLTAIATYFLTKELWNAGAGLFAAAFIAIAPGYISRSVAGSFDNEGIAIFALQCSFFLWIRAMRTGSMFWGIMTAFCYFYMVSAWGGYVLKAREPVYKDRQKDRFFRPELRI